MSGVSGVLVGERATHLEFVLFDLGLEGRDFVTHGNNCLGGYGVGVGQW